MATTEQIQVDFIEDKYERRKQKHKDHLDLEELNRASATYQLPKTFLMM